MKKLPSLDGKTLKELQSVAKTAKVPGWHEMRKADLLLALAKLSEDNLVSSAGSKSNASAADSPAGLSKVAKKTGKQGASVVQAASSDRLSGGKTVRKSPVEPVPMAAATVAPGRKKVATVVSGKSAAKPDTSKGSATAPVSSSEVAARSASALPAPAVPEESVATGLSSGLSSGVPEVSPVMQAPLSEAQQKISVLKQKLMEHKTLGTSSLASKREAADQLLLMVRDPFWLHAYWEISAQLVERVRAAMGHLWHTADPVLRLYKFNSDHAGTLRQQYMTDIHIHGGINNWYIDVDDPPSSFKVDIGYLARDGQFFALLSSNIVETPQRYVHEAFGHPDVSWNGVPADMGDSGLVRDSLLGTQGKPGARLPADYEFDDEDEIPSFRSVDQRFSLEVDAELVIKGKTDPGVQLAIKGGTIRLKEDGTFSIRYHLPERRHVFPVVASSRDGLETQTVILAVERNTKVLETVISDEGED
ncbi:MAG: DUF4912 domain-containing protein [Planctomycetia bacterium]|nr:DUF4912 domain-containing protein [Planctomycetia bacterium]